MCVCMFYCVFMPEIKMIMMMMDGSWNRFKVKFGAAWQRSLP